MKMRWKFWQCPTSAERREELQRRFDELEDGAIIPMTQAEIKAITPTQTGASIFRQAIDDLRNDPVRMAEFAVAWKKWTERFPFPKENEL